MSLENSICRTDAPRVSCRGMGLLLTFLLLTCGARAMGSADSIFVDGSSNRDSTMMREERIDQVVVTGTRTPRVLKDVPALTRVVTKREIDASIRVLWMICCLQPSPGLSSTSTARRRG